MIVRYCLGITLLPLLSWGGPVGLARLDRLIDQASVILVGHVVEGSQAGASVSVVLDAERVLKGSVGARVYSASLTVSNEFAITRQLKGVRGLWFLEAEPNGAYRVIPTMVGSVPFEFSILPALTSLPATWEAPASATATERVLRELAAALEAKDTVDAGLSADFLSQIPANSGSSLGELYRRMLRSPNGAIFSAGLAGLIRGGHAAALATLRSSLGQSTEQRDVALAQAVCEYVNGNPSGLATLSEFATKPQPISRLRECAAHSLRNIHTREAVPFLVSLLDSDSVALRYEGVAGLASYANSGFIPGESRLSLDGTAQPRLRSAVHTDETEENFPTLANFVRDEGRYSGFWKNWLKTVFNVIPPQQP